MNDIVEFPNTTQQVDGLRGGGAAWERNLVWLSLHSSYSHSSLALPLLHVAVEAAATKGGSGAKVDGGWRWQEISTTIQAQPFAVAARVAAARPQVVAATAYLFNRNGLLEILRRVRVLQPECLIILGGPEFLGDNRRFLEDEASTVTAVLRGEGERGFARWLGATDDAAQWPDIPGLCWLDRKGRYRDNGLAQAAAGESLDDLPPPTTSCFYDFTRPFAAIETARGCFAKCAYCTSSTSDRVTVASLLRVQDMLGEITRHGVKEVRVLDRTFNSNGRRCRQLLECFAADFPALHFHIEVHPAFLSQEVRSALRQFPAGRLHIEAGLQTASSVGLQLSERSGLPEQAWEGLRFLCGQENFQTHVDLLAGLPGVTYDQTLRDLLDLVELGPTEIQLETLKVLPGTRLRDEAAALGVDYGPDPPYEVLRTNEISPEGLLQAQQLSRLIDEFYNEPQLRQALRQALAAGGAGFVDRLRLRLAGEFDNYMPRSLVNRFRLFHELAGEDVGLGAARDTLEYQWLRAGHSPQHGICPARAWSEQLPERTRLHEGDVQAIRLPGRVWQAEIGGREYWFVFPGRRKLRFAAAVYVSEK